MHFYGPLPPSITDRLLIASSQSFSPVEGPPYMTSTKKGGFGEQEVPQICRQYSDV